MYEPVGMAFHRPPRHLEAYVRLLATHAPVHTLWMGPAYHCTAYPEPSRPLLALTATHAERLRGGFEALSPELSAWQPFLALVEEKRAVSVCRSVRITPAAHEAGVETLPAFRGRGYAPDVVAGWARVVQSLGAMPFWPSNNIAVIECQIGSPRSEHTTHCELMSPTALRIARQRHAYSVPCVLDHDVRDSPGSDAGHILDWPGKNHRYA